MINNKIGVLGGGQLGKMLCQEASRLGIRLHILDRDDSFPAAGVCPDFNYGDFSSYEDVYTFGKDKDILTVEIESVNTEALYQLEKEGVKVFPQPHVLDTIKDKGTQKTFYADHRLPTSSFKLYKDEKSLAEAIEQGDQTLPFVQKTRMGGYDGQGVKIIKTKEDVAALLKGPCLAEDLVEIDKEISVIVARNESGEIKAFPVVEMAFHPTANLVEYLFSPANITEAQEEEAEDLAIRIAEKMGIVGLLAVEMFLDQKGKILINEVAPRPHNSGHQSIEGNYTSQYAQHLRAILNLPLGDTSIRTPSVMVNLLGDPDHTGPTYYAHINECLKEKGVNLHLYGKAMTKPFRKMGHATIIAEKLDDAIKIAKFVKDTLRIISK